jgi:hypothetical protein
MKRARPPQPLPTPNELAHAPELAILIALDTVLEMTSVKIHLAVPELELVPNGHQVLHPEFDDRELTVAQDILDLIDALKCTIHLYRRLSLPP